MDETLRCNHSNETSSAVLSHGTIYLVCSLTFESVDEILRCYHSNETSTAVLSCGYYIFYDVALTLSLWMKSYGATFQSCPILST